MVNFSPYGILDEPGGLHLAHESVSAVSSRLQLVLDDDRTRRGATKQLEVLRELVPTATVMAALINPTNPNADAHARDLQAAAAVVGCRQRWRYAQESPSGAPSPASRPARPSGQRRAAVAGRDACGWLRRAARRQSA
jgi:hypothetical protein